MSNSILPKNDQLKVAGATHSLWVDDELWAEIGALARESGHTNSKTIVLLVQAAIKALRLEQAKEAAKAAAASAAAMEEAATHGTPKAKP